MSASPGIILEKASLSFGKNQIFKDINLSLNSGEWAALLGPSGIGKSSLLRLIADLPANGGSLAGTSRASDGTPLRGRVGYMAQRDLLLPWLSLLDNILLGLRLRSVDITSDHYEKATALLETVGLADQIRNLPMTLSGGMRQRAALARTLMEDCPFILMDEPFSALDAITRYQLQETAVSLLSGRTVLLVTHDPMEALRICDRIFILSGAPAEISEHIPPPTSSKPRDSGSQDMASAAAHLTQKLALQSGFAA